MDTDTLVSLVYAKSPIWDKRNKLHANRGVIDSLWKEIAQELQYEETILRKKWKYLREKFTSEYNKQPLSGSRWPYFQQLMFLKDVVQTKPSSSSGSAAGLSASSGTSLAPLDDAGPAADDDADMDDAESHSSQGSASTNASNQQLLLEEPVEKLPKKQEAIVTVADTPQQLLFTPSASSSLHQTPLSLKRKQKNQKEDYYQRMCAIEERKLEYLREKRSQKRATADPDRDNEDLMFLRTLLPHIRKIPQRMKLRFQSRVLSVVEEFAYGPQHDQPDTVVYQDYGHSTVPPPGD